MSDLGTWLIVTGLLVGPGVRRLVRWRRARAKRALAEAPPARVSDIGDGVFTATGKASARQATLTAPVSGRPCLAWHLSVEQNTSNGWIELLANQDAVPFLLTDPSGTIDVEPGDHYELSLGQARWIEVETLAPPHGDDRAFKKVEDVLASCFVTPRRSPLGLKPKLRYREQRLDADDTVVVSGVATRDIRGDGQRSHPRAPPEIIALRGLPDTPLVIAT